MVMDYLKRRAEEKCSEPHLECPEWVSSKNASFRAWQYVEQLRNEKALYIKRHDKAKDFSKKGAYLIKGSEVAAALGVSRASLNNTSNYSPYFRRYLNEVNAELEVAKEEKLKKAKKEPSRGSIRSSKSQLFTANTELKRKICELEAKKVEELVLYAFDQLPLPVKKKLGLD